MFSKLSATKCDQDLSSGEHEYSVVMTGLSNEQAKMCLGSNYYVTYHIYLNIKLMHVLSEWWECEEQAWISVCVTPTCISLCHIITFSSLTLFVLNNEPFVLSDASTCRLSSVYINSPWTGDKQPGL